ncbi:MAG: hypothetical protein K2J67_01605 [Lachnospiraceae bacterium]|nr:hypothetical protein [Lachnospiraceae bacterium]
MYAESFEFNGVDSRDVGICMMDFDGFNNDGVASLGDEVSFITTRAARSDRLNFHGHNREQTMTLNFQIGKDPATAIDMEFSREELAFLKAWLERRDGYHFLRFFQKGYEDTYFYCQIHVEWVRVTGRIVGAELSVTCNAPYGYSGIQGIDVEVPDGGSFIVYNDSDEQGGLEIDQVEIGLKDGSDCTLTLTNHLENIYTLADKPDTVAADTSHATRIYHCNTGEQIVIDGRHHSISTSKSHQSRHTNGSICEDFNFHYPRLINISTNLPLLNYIPSNDNYPSYDENRINRFTVTGAHCHVTLAYRTIRSVMP